MPSAGFEDPAEFFSMIFGGEAFVDLIGEISLMKDLTHTIDITAEQMEEEAAAAKAEEKLQAQDEKEKEATANSTTASTAPPPPPPPVLLESSFFLFHTHPSDLVVPL